MTKVHGIKSSESWKGKVAFTGNPEWGQPRVTNLLCCSLSVHGTTYFSLTCSSVGQSFSVMQPILNYAQETLLLP